METILYRPLYTTNSIMIVTSFGKVSISITFVDKIGKRSTLSAWISFFRCQSFYRNFHPFVGSFYHWYSYWRIFASVLATETIVSNALGEV